MFYIFGSDVCVIIQYDTINIPGKYFIKLSSG